MRSLGAMAEVGAPCTWVLCNHDVARHVTRYGGGAVGLARARAAALVQLSLPGAAYIYNGDELGLPNVDLPDWALQDPTWERAGTPTAAATASGCRCRGRATTPPFGFSERRRDLAADARRVGGADGRGRSRPILDSTLALYRRAIETAPASRRATGRLEWYGAPADCLAFRRKGGGLICALNAADGLVPLPPGEMRSPPAVRCRRANSRPTPRSGSNRRFRSAGAATRGGAGARRRTARPTAATSRSR